MLGREGSGALLGALEATGVFVVALDPNCEWYRCHQLFRDAQGARFHPLQEGLQKQFAARTALGLEI